MKLNLNDESGFTLLEALISLMVSSMIMLLLASGINALSAAKDYLVSDSQSLTDINKVIYEDRQLEWHSFLNQLEYNLKNSKNPKVTQLEFSVEEWDKEEQQYFLVRYDRSATERRSFLRYKKNGNTRMLSNVYLPTFKQDNGWLLLDFSFRNGESYQGKVWMDSWIKENIEE